MSPAKPELVSSQPPYDRVDFLLNHELVRAFMNDYPDQRPEANRALKRYAVDAAEWLVKEHDNESDEVLARSLHNILPRLLKEKIEFFFSYKAKDKKIAQLIAEKLERWSNGKLAARHMGELGTVQAGRDWREKIEKMIPQCDWFLLLLPSPEDARDWELFEAGYFLRGQGLGGRLVCLHHPDNEVADALGARQSVPAELEKVHDFLKGLFHEPNWIPGLKPLNPGLEQLDEKAKEIVDLIKPPERPGVKFCCGPHMEIAFEDASKVSGWDQLAKGRVIESNDDCRRLFGLQIPREFFKDWIRDSLGDEQDSVWINQFANAVKAVGEGRIVPPVAASFSIGGRQVQPKICAVRRRKADNRVDSIDILFQEVELPSVTASMKPELAAMSITLDFAVRFRYQLLNHFAGRKLEHKDVLDFQRRATKLRQQAIVDGRFMKDPMGLREKTLSLFDGEDKEVIAKMYERGDQLWPPDGSEGEMDRALAGFDTETLTNLVQELLTMNQDFLTVSAKRFAELIV